VFAQVYLSSQPNAGDIFPTAAVDADIYAEMDFSDGCDPKQAGVDAADCQQEFRIKTSTPPGRYTIMWWWEFNAGEFYNTCADVFIEAASDGDDDAPPSDDKDDDNDMRPINRGTVTAIGVLYGECQTLLDSWRMEFFLPASAAGNLICAEQGEATARYYRQLVELQGVVDFIELSATSTCDQLFDRVQNLCDKMSDLNQQGLGTTDGDSDGDRTSCIKLILVGLGCGFALGILAREYGVPWCMKKINGNKSTSGKAFSSTMVSVTTTASPPAPQIVYGTPQVPLAPQSAYGAPPGPPPGPPPPQTDFEVPPGPPPPVPPQKGGLYGRQ